MKKILSIVLAALLLFTVIPFAAFAADGPTVSVSNAAVCPGQIFQFDVTISGNTGFSALRVDLAIPQGFTVLNITCGTNFTNLQFTPNPAAGIATFATSTTATADGVLCTFIVQADAFAAAGNYSFGFEACDFYGADLQAASVATVAGTVAAAHTIGTETCKDQVCAKCGVTVLGTGHQYGDFVYNNDATCTQDGFVVYTCTTCGHSYNGESVAAYGHSYESTTVAPTCATAGPSSSPFPPTTVLRARRKTSADCSPGKTSSSSHSDRMTPKTSPPVWWPILIKSPKRWSWR